jgi:hypothetical protein
MDPVQELLKAFELVAEYERQRPQIIKEYRLYYNEDGSIRGLWETDHPEGNYVVIDNPDVFNRQSTQLLKVVNGQLTVIDPQAPQRIKLKKSNAGQAVVRGNAALVIMVDEIYSDTEYYDQTNN